MDELLSCLTILKTMDPVTEEPLSLNCFTDVMNAGTIPKVFIALSNYFSFFNYDIIDLIVTELGTKEDEQELQKYKNEFQLYARRRVYECPQFGQFGPMNEIDHADILVKVDSHYESYTVQELWGFRKRLSEILNISSAFVQSASYVTDQRQWTSVQKQMSNQHQAPLAMVLGFRKLSHSCAEVRIQDMQLYFGHKVVQVSDHWYPQR